MNFYAVIFDEPRLGKICCGRSSSEGYFMFVGKYDRGTLLQLNSDELNYFHTITNSLYIEKVIGHTFTDGSIHKQIEIDNADKDFLLSLSGVYFNNDNPGVREMFMNNIIDKGKLIKIISESELPY